MGIVKDTAQPAYKSKAVRKRINVNQRIQDLVAGKISVRDLDDDEIYKCRIRNAAGGFSPRPEYIPGAMVDLILREQQRRFNEWVTESVPEARRAVMDLIKSPRLQPGDRTRLEAANMILERFAGKIPDRVEVSAEVKHYERVLEGVLVDVDEIEDAEIEMDL